VKAWRGTVLTEMVPYFVSTGYMMSCIVNHCKKLLSTCQRSQLKLKGVFMCRVESWLDLNVFFHQVNWSYTEWKKVESLLFPQAHSTSLQGMFTYNCCIVSLCTQMSVLDQSKASMSHIRHYQAFLWATGLLTLLQSITEGQDPQAPKMGKSILFWLHFPLYLPPR